MKIKRGQLGQEKKFTYCFEYCLAVSILYFSYYVIPLNKEPSPFGKGSLGVCLFVNSVYRKKSISLYLGNSQY